MRNTSRRWRTKLETVDGCECRHLYYTHQFKFAFFHANRNQQINMKKIGKQENDKISRNRLGGLIYGFGEVFWAKHQERSIFHLHHITTTLSSCHNRATIQPSINTSSTPSVHHTATTTWSSLPYPRNHHKSISDCHCLTNSLHQHQFYQPKASCGLIFF